MNRLATHLLLALATVSGLAPVFATGRKLQPIGHFENKAIDESSGIVASLLWEGVFWTHNDSGDKARIFAVDRQGREIRPEWAENYQGILLPSAVNVDWEDIGRDLAGNLLIADTGNNANQRRDLTVYVVPEPSPRETVQTRPIRELHFHYPDQMAFPPEKMNYDCEAIFWADGALHLLTKHRSDTDTRLFRLDPQPGVDSTPLKLLGSFPIGAQVTGADVSLDGNQLAVLTYDAVHLFERSAPGQNWFTGRETRLAIEAGQCEAICIDRDALRITNEGGEIFLVPMSELHLPGGAPGGAGN